MRLPSLQQYFTTSLTVMKKEQLRGFISFLPEEELNYTSFHQPTNLFNNSLDINQKRGGTKEHLQAHEMEGPP